MVVEQLQTITKDVAVFDLIKKEVERQTHGVELIASENYVSQQVMQAMGSVLTNKYAEGYPGKRYYGGCEVVDEIEQIAIDRAKDLFGAAYANVQPHSGAQANAAVFLAVLNAGDTILGFDLAHGGHLTHGSKVNFSGKIYRSTFYGVEEDTGTIDMNKVRDIAKKEQPKLIICGASAYSRDWQYETFREIADEIGALLLCDMAHPAGLIAKGILNDPLPHCHIVTTTTHKTLRGPRGGMILMGSDFDNPWGRTTKKGTTIKMSSVLNGGVFPGTQGGPLEHVIAAKAVAYAEALTDDFMEYALQVKRNADAMATELVKKNYHIISNGTDNHLMLIDLSNKNITGKKAEYVLGLADITVNKNMVPFDKESPFVTSGIRIGTPAITTRGLKENDCIEIVNLIDEVLTNPDDEAKLNNTKQKVQAKMKAYPLFENDVV